MILTSGSRSGRGGGFWMLGGPEGKSTVDLRNGNRNERQCQQFHHCYRNHRTGDGSGSGYAGIRYHRQDLRRLQLRGNQRQN